MKLSWLTISAALICSLSMPAIAEEFAPADDAIIGAEEVAEVESEDPTPQDEYLDEVAFEQWMDWEATQDNSAFFINAATGGDSGLKVVVSKSKQRLYLYLNGKPLLKGEGIKVSTGTPANETKVGTFKPGPLAEKRKSFSASKAAGRNVFLYKVVPFYGGQWLHSASVPGQNWLGKKRSHGCIRVDRNYIGMVYKLIRQHHKNAQIVVTK